MHVITCTKIRVYSHVNIYAYLAMCVNKHTRISMHIEPYTNM